MSNSERTTSTFIKCIRAWRSRGPAKAEVMQTGWRSDCRTRFRACPLPGVTAVIRHGSWLRRGRCTAFGNSPGEGQKQPFLARVPGSCQIHPSPCPTATATCPHGSAHPLLAQPRLSGAHFGSSQRDRQQSTARLMATSIHGGLHRLTPHPKPSYQCHPLKRRFSHVQHRAKLSKVSRRCPEHISSPKPAHRHLKRSMGLPTLRPQLNTGAVHPRHCTIPLFQTDLTSAQAAVAHGPC